MEELETDTLYLAATRPPLIFGVPLVVCGFLIIMTGLVVVLMRNPLYLASVIPVWLGARVLVARDYNAMGVVYLYLKTAGRSVDSPRWGGASVTPFPIRIQKRGRGMVDAG